MPVRAEFRDSCPSQQMWQWHLSLAFSKFVEDDLPHEASPWLVVLDLPYAPGRDRFQRPVTGSGTGTRRKHSAWISKKLNVLPQER